MPIPSLVRWLFSTPRLVPTVGGWTPGLRTLLGGTVLPCGCLAGRYLTWRGRTVTIIDGPSHDCGAASHVLNAIVDAGTTCDSPLPADPTCSTSRA